MSLLNPDPTCTVNATATTNGVDVTASSTVTIALVDTAGVKQWNLSCINTDETNVAATVTAGLTINLVNKTATFTAPAAGSALIFQSKVNNGRNADGTPNPTLTTTFGVYVLTATSLRVGAFGEKTEGSATFGWVVKVNNMIRNATLGGATYGAGLLYSGGVVSVDMDSNNVPGTVVQRRSVSGECAVGPFECDTLHVLGGSSSVDGSLEVMGQLTSDFGEVLSDPKWGQSFTESRMVNGQVLPRTSGWQYAFADIWENSTLGAQLEIAFNPPEGATINSLTVQYKGSGGHGALPATKPTIAIGYYDASAGTTTVATSVQADTSANVAAFELKHNIVANNGGAGIGHVVSKAGRRYYVLIAAEFGANAIIGAFYYSAVINWTRPLGGNIGRD